MKKAFSVFLLFSVFVLIFVTITGCSNNDYKTNKTTAAEITDDYTTEYTNEATKYNYTSKNTSEYTTRYFSNAYGTANTICAHSGCNNYIASTGDTNCCIVHSNRCLECGKYIDEDAMYCISCLKKAANKVQYGY